jgi:hypothetical protein
MEDDRDRFGDKLHELEKARENQWAREHDQRLLEKLRHQHNVDVHCIECNTKLVARAIRGVAVMICPSEHGGWLDGEALRQFIKG